ncbi:MAG: CRTAC1 family protein [Gemmatimonadota bacterium]
MAPVLAAACAGPSDPPASFRFTRVVGGDLAADTSSSPSASWIDIDADGDEDLYVLNGYATLAPERGPQRNVFYRNDEGVLIALADHPLVADDAFSGSGVWGDYDNDGDADLFVANQRGPNFLFRADGGGAFTRVTDGPVATDGGRSFTAAWVDIDRDGDLDLHVPNGWSGGGVDFLYRNDGDGAFTRLVDLPLVMDSLPSGGPAWGDYDGDGDPDLFLPFYSDHANRLYRNDGEWAFAEVAADVGLSVDPLPASPRASVAHWVDYDDDGDLDLFVGNTMGRMDFLYRNQGGRFERVTAGRLGLDGTYVSDAIWVDLDNDADRDLVLAVWGAASEIYRNDGRGGLFPAGAVVFASSVSASDIDRDGDLDLFLTQWPINEAGGAPNLLFRNEGPTGNWLDVTLEGTASNRSAIGATIFVTAEVGGVARRQRRDVVSRTSWRSANGPTRHFGLGNAAEVDRIEVVWPSGAADTLVGPIRANRRVTVVEGAAQ